MLGPGRCRGSRAEGAVESRVEPVGSARRRGCVGAHLACKAARAGGVLVRVSALYMLQRCHVCGFVDRVSGPGQAAFLCTSCGWSGKAGASTSLDIRAAGLSSMDVEISGSPGTGKCQPPGKTA
ncbi:zinc ribbon domain-containing protein [Frankia gtarii]|uniref:zinc ribbon domain-containing protein n=1 Tax=Frankia gtarii TaxID=2950102 RepID=UPI003F689374